MKCKEYVTRYEEQKAIVCEDGLNIASIRDIYVLPELCLLAVQENGQALEHLSTTMAFNSSTIKEIALQATLSDVGVLAQAQKLHSGVLDLFNYFIVAYQQYSRQIASMGKAEYLETHTFDSIEAKAECVRNDAAMMPLEEREERLAQCRMEKIAKAYADIDAFHDLSLIPETLRTARLCYDCVRKDGMQLGYVPDMWRTRKMCSLALDNTPDSVCYVPVRHSGVPEFAAFFAGSIDDKIEDAKQPEVASKQPGSERQDLDQGKPVNEWVVDGFMDQCGVAASQVANSPADEKQETKEARDERLATEGDVTASASVVASKEEGADQSSAKSWAVRVLKTPADLSKAPAAIAARILPFVISRLGMKEIFRYIPDTLKNFEMCVLAVHEDPWNIGYVPYDILCENNMYIMLDAMEENSGKYANIREACTEFPEPTANEKAKLVEMNKMYGEWKHKVAFDGLMLQDIPEDFRTYSLCCEAVKKEWSALQYVPEVLRIKDICKLALMRSEGAMAYIPQNVQSMFVVKGA